jgi:hypothetical protein
MTLSSPVDLAKYISVLFCPVLLSISLSNLQILNCLSVIHDIHPLQSLGSSLPITGHDFKDTKNKRISKKKKGFNVTKTYVWCSIRRSSFNTNYILLKPFIPITKHKIKTFEMKFIWIKMWNSKNFVPWPCLQNLPYKIVTKIFTISQNSSCLYPTVKSLKPTNRNPNVQVTELLKKMA